MLYRPSDHRICQSATFLMAARMSLRLSFGERSLASGPGLSGSLPAASRSDNAGEAAEGAWEACPDAQGSRETAMGSAIRMTISVFIISLGEWSVWGGAGTPAVIADKVVDKQLIGSAGEERSNGLRGSVHDRLLDIEGSIQEHGHASAHLESVDQEPIALVYFTRDRMYTSAAVAVRDRAE